MLTKAAAACIVKQGHTIVGDIDALTHDAAEMLESGADVYVLDRYMCHPDGESLKRQLKSQKCILIGADLNAALEELEVYSQTCAPDDLCTRINEELIALGFHLNTRGSRQLAAALQLVLQDDRRLCDLRRYVYPVVAERFASGWQSVERNLRYAIESVWTHGNLTHIQKLFGYTVEAERGKPTNKAFLAQLAEHIRLHRA